MWKRGLYLPALKSSTSVRLTVWDVVKQPDVLRDPVLWIKEAVVCVAFKISAAPEKRVQARVTLRTVPSQIKKAAHHLSFASLTAAPTGEGARNQRGGFVRRIGASGDQDLIFLALELKEEELPLPPSVPVGPEPPHFWTRLLQNIPLKSPACCFFCTH